MNLREAGRVRCRSRIEGVVQGVGFRPFVYRVASSEGLAGWVANQRGSVALEVEGPAESVERFFARLERERPPGALVRSMSREPIEAAGERAFQIRASQEAADAGTALTGLALAPDAATCAECLAELFSPSNRRYRYPFTTCVACGPRYTIALALPFDRASTSMRAFGMCAACRAEYADPADRRFHSQTNACAACGPRLELRDPKGARLALGEAALTGAAAALRQGAVVAVKGVGGYHLMADATSEAAVARVRAGKGRPDKPLAVLVAGAEEAASFCLLSPIERAMLESPEAPIVLLRARERREAGLAGGLAPGLRQLGLLRASNPLQHLLLREAGCPLAATSGNLSDEAICFEDDDAFERLAGAAALVLGHDRPIVRGLDDSIARELAGRPVVLRRGRGHVPAALPLETGLEAGAMLAFGGQLKNAIALSRQGVAILGPHVGTLDSARALSRYEEELSRLPRFFGSTPVLAVCDGHPDYASTLAGERAGLPLVRVQHHEAHVLACLADNGQLGPALGVAWDGGGFGGDGTVWGGEFLAVDGQGAAARAGFLRRFRLPGAEQAVREPRRAALGLLFELRGQRLFSDPPATLRGMFTDEEWAACAVLLERGLNSPFCSSVGRLFDAVAALLGVRARCSYEGQAAMELEGLAWAAPADDSSYGLALAAGGAPPPAPFVLDWQELVEELQADAGRGESREAIAARFHRALARGALLGATRAGQRKVALTGGVFQNRFLAEAAIGELRAAGFEPLWHRSVPPGDGGLALGQLAAASARQRRGV